MAVLYSGPLFVKTMTPVEEYRALSEQRDKCTKGSGEYAKLTERMSAAAGKVMDQEGGAKKKKAAAKKKPVAKKPATKKTAAKKKSTAKK